MTFVTTSPSVDLHGMVEPLMNAFSDFATSFARRDLRVETVGKPIPAALVELSRWRRMDAKTLGVEHLPTDASFDVAEYAIRRTVAESLEPEVSVEDYGTILIIWRAVYGFATLEVGDKRFGFTARSSEYPDARFNLDNSQIEDSLNVLHAYFGPRADRHSRNVLSQFDASQFGVGRSCTLSAFA